VKQEYLKHGIYDEYHQDQSILNLFCEYYIAYTLKVKGIRLEEADLSPYTTNEL
jgi:hypothetical protein